MSAYGKPVSELIAPYTTRFDSGEVNTRVSSHDVVKAKIAEITTTYQSRNDGAQIDTLDGVTVNYPTWWLNVRGSNTEPLLRLNVEGDTQALMEQHRDEALKIIQE